MNPAHLADKLAKALDAIVPEPYRVREYQAMVLIEGAGYRAASEVEEIIDSPGDVMEHAEVVSLDALSLIQDYIVEDLTTPWPDTGTSLPSPRVEVSPDEIRLWFAFADGRVLEVPTIRW